jgi:hypothetical protein
MIVTRRHEQTHIQLPKRRIYEIIILHLVVNIVEIHSVVLDYVYSQDFRK